MTRCFEVGSGEYDEYSSQKQNPEPKSQRDGQNQVEQIVYVPRGALPALETAVIITQSEQALYGV